MAVQVVQHRRQLLQVLLDDRKAAAVHGLHLDLAPERPDDAQPDGVLAGG